MSDAVRNQLPPSVVTHVSNPVLRRLLPSSIGRRMKGLALLEFEGRRSSRCYRVVCGWHEDGDDGVVFTPARWRLNFTDGAIATVVHLGQQMTCRGDLVTDSAAVAASMAEILGSGRSPRSLGLHVPDGHVLTATDVVTVDRAMIRFTRL